MEPRTTPEEPEARAGVDIGVPGCEDAIVVGRGGFGVVYRAWQPRFHRTVAVKILHLAEMDDEGRRRFEREVRALGSLTGHPHIVSIFDAGFTADGAPYLVMGYEEGGSLADRLRKCGPLPWTEAVEIGIKLAGALEAAHRAGILHRDIKPENVLVSGYGEPKLADFGIARIEGATATKTGALLATIPHAAPELLAGEPPSVASDIYALGSTLYTLIRGRPAFAAARDENPLAMMMRVGSHPIPDLRPLGVPDAVCATLQRAMSRQPRDRHPTPEVLGRDLRAVAQHAQAHSSSFRRHSPQTEPNQQSLRNTPPRPRADAVVDTLIASTAVSAPGRTQSMDPPNHPDRRVPRPRTRPLAIASVLAAAAVAGVGGLVRSHFATQSASSAWTSATPMPTAGRQLSGTVGPAGRLYVVGFNGDSMFAYSPSTGAWSTTAPIPEPTYNYAIAADHDGRIFVIGGLPTSSHLDADRAVRVYAPTTNTWTFAARMPNGHGYHVSVTGGDGKIYVIGGQGSAGDNKVDIYSPDSNTWAEGPSAPSPVFDAAAAVARDGRIYIIGGYDRGAGAMLASVQVYDPVAGSWGDGAPMPTPRFQLGAATAIDGRIYVFGGGKLVGRGSTALDTVEVYSPATNRWTKAASMPTAREGLALIGAPDGRFYAIGGDKGSPDTDGSILAGVDIYTPSADRSLPPSSLIDPALPTVDSWTGLSRRRARRCVRRACRGRGGAGRCRISHEAP